MKKLAVVLCLLCSFFVNMTASASIILEYDGGVHNYTGAVYNLSVNGKKLTDLPLEPIIFNDRALVPVREVFEALGAEVDYSDSDKSIAISYGKNSVKLKIGSVYATVNDVKKTIPDNVAPRLIAKWGESAKTMVPVRFISESVGLDVEFDGDKGLISISDVSTAKPTATPVVKRSVRLEKISYKQDGNTVTVTVSANNAVEKMSKASVTSSGVLYADIYDADYSAANKTEVNLGAVKAVRLGLHDDCTRIAVDTEGMTGHSVSLSSDKKAVVITVTSGGGASAAPSASPSPSPTAAPSVSPTASPSQTAKPISYSSEKIVVIDAGHGGSDPGAIGNLMTADELKAYNEAVASTEVILPTMSPGTAGKYNEKDIALKVAKKVQQNLEAKGIKVIMTRTGDTYPELDERPALANSKGAVIFVSIHLNSTSSAVTAAKGIEVYYSEQNNDDDIKLTSKQLSSLLLEKTISSSGAKSRGVKTGNLLVNRKCLMPSALIEIGFMNNPEELGLLITDSYQSKLADGISQGILSAWNKVQFP